MEAHGVESLYTGLAANWVEDLFDFEPSTLRNLVSVIANEAGFSYETIYEYDDGARTLEIAIGAHLHAVWLRETASFETHRQRDEGGKRDLLGAEAGFVYIAGMAQDQFDFCGNAEMPDILEKGLANRISPFWGEDIGTAGFAALHSIEGRKRFGDENCLVIPKSRLEEFPVNLPTRTEITELYEAFRIHEGNIERVLSSPATGVDFEDGSPCYRWLKEIRARRIGNDIEIDAPPLGEQQKIEVGHTVQEYRDCFGDGETVTDFEFVEITQPVEAEVVRLYGFGIFQHGESIRVPVAPASNTPLPVYPQSESAFKQARKLLDEFPRQPPASPNEAHEPGDTSNEEIADEESDRLSVLEELDEEIRSG